MTRNKRLTKSERKQIIVARRESRFTEDKVLVNKNVRRLSR